MSVRIMLARDGKVELDRWVEHGEEIEITPEFIVTIESSGDTAKLKGSPYILRILEDRKIKQGKKCSTSQKT